MKMRFDTRVLLVAAGAMLSGCAGGPVAMDEAQRAEIRKAGTINVIYHGPVGPSVTTAKGVVIQHFTLNLAGYTPGLALMKQNGVDDPLIAMRKRLMDRLAADGGVKNLTLGQAPVPIDQVDPANIQQRYGKGLHLQIYPTNWTVVYYVSNWSRYYMMYGAVGRLVRAEDGKTLWSASCGVRRDDGDKAPTFDQLMANRAAMFKSWTQDAAQKCADELANAFLGKST
jgi:hypothetical protein